MRDYGEFRLRIERGTEEGTYRVECSGLAGDGSGGFTMPFSATELENFVLKVGRTRRGVRKIESPEMQLARKFGGQLFGAVMQGKTGELYRAASSEARATGQGLRITLSLTDVPELGGIPWEYLYDEPNFLSINAWTPVVRYLDLPKPRRALEVELPLRILGVISNPLDSEPLDVDVEKAKLENALKPLTDANAVTIDWLEEPTLLALTKKLRPDTYHILHFIGHGGFDDANGEGALLFEDAAGRGRAVSGDQLAAVLYEKRSLRLVLLNSCEGARNSVQDPFSGVAASLVQREIPAVIGMQFEITDRAAVLFASEFYAMLAEGQPIDSAISEARLAIWADSNDVEWGTPVLFMRVADGRLFNVTHAAALPRPNPQDLPPKAEPSVRDVAAAAIAGAAIAEPPVAEPPIAEPPPVVTRSPPVVEPPTVVEPEPSVVQPEPSVVQPEPPVEKPAEKPAEKRAEESVKLRPFPPVTRRKVAIGVAAVAALMAVVLIGLRLLLPPASRPTIEVSADNALETGRIVVTGMGFAPREPVEIYLDNVWLTKVRAGADGSITREIEVTENNKEVTFSGSTSGDATTAFVLTAQASSSPTPSESTGPSASGPTPSGSIGPAVPISPGIAFYSNAADATGSTDAELYNIDPESGAIDQLTFNTLDDRYPDWSPDYKQLTFSRRVGTDPRDVFLLDLSNLAPTSLVADSTWDWNSNWSGDDWIAYVLGDPRKADPSAIWKIRPDGTGAQQILAGSRLRGPAWNTDGARLAMMAAGDGGEFDLYAVGADGTGLVQLTHTTVLDRDPSWSPNGDTIAFVRDKGGSNEESDIYLLDMATMAVAQLTSDNLEDGNPVWSGDGGQIAFVKATDDTHSHIWLMNADGSDAHDLMPDRDGKNMDLSWH